MSLRYSRSEAHGGFGGQLVKWLLKSPWAADSEYTRLISKETHSMLPAYTDYPIDSIFDDINDTNEFVAPVRKIIILTFDRNKYCDVLVFFTDSNGDERATIAHIKAGYCYKNEARNYAGITFDYDELTALPWRS